MKKNVIAFKKGFLVCPANSQDNRVIVSTVNSELMQFGFMLSEEAFEQLSKSDPAFIIEWAECIIGYLKTFLGDGEKHVMLHSGFPKSVMAAPIEELYFKAILHYWSKGKILFDDRVTKEYAFEHVEYKMISYGTEGDFRNIFKKLAQVNTAITPADYKILEWFVKDYREYNMPAEIPFKENLCMIAALGADVPVKTSTDILRIASYLSHGHSDLIIPVRKVKESTWSKTLVDNPERAKYKFKLSNQQRNLVMTLLEKVAFIPEMKERHKMWNKLAHHIHPTQYEKLFPKAVEALRAMDSSNPVFNKHKTFSSRLENARTLAEKLEVLKRKPGMFARKMNELLLKHPTATDSIMRTFREIGDKISNKVLFEIMTYFKGRLVKEDKREVFVKGARRATPLPILPALPEDTVEAINETIWLIFSDKFAKLEPLGKVWIDEELKKIPLPTNMRTLSDSLIPTVRGQRMSLVLEKKVVRCYIHWTAGQDLDLSVELITEDGKTQHCSYSDLRPHPNLVHSGDLRPHNTGKWAEYVDIILKDNPFRYAMMTVNNFSGGALNGTGIKCGFMERDKAESDKTWLPKTITNAIDISTSSRNAALVIIDLKEKEWILVDQDLAGIPVSRGTEIEAFVKSLAEMPKISVHHMLKLHAEARGVIVTEMEDAETLFNFADFSTDYTETIKYML